MIEGDVVTQIRCPVCCIAFDGKAHTLKFDAFSAAHETCKGQTFSSCACEWERLCDGTTLLCRTAECPECAKKYPDGSCLKCPGCRECQAPPMSPIALKVTLGLEDDRLLHHLRDLEQCESQSARGLSDEEKRLRHLIWERLDCVTR